MFKKATKSQAKLRCALFGASGSGKTFSALRMARGMGDNIALIDTEHYSASKYSDRFDFDVANLISNDIASYVKAIEGAKDSNYDVLIIDSLSHAWSELLAQIDKIAKARYKGNTWSAWSEGTPMQKSLINAILTFPGHVIATMRCKTEWTLEQTNRGTSRPVRVALAPEQGKGIEYEFDLLIEIGVDHFANVIKDRTGKFQDYMIEKPDENFGEEIKSWLDDGESYLIDAEQVKELQAALQDHEVNLEKFYQYFSIKHLHQMLRMDFDKAVKMIATRPPKKQTIEQAATPTPTPAAIQPACIYSEKKQEDLGDNKGALDDAPKLTEAEKVEVTRLEGKKKIEEHLNNIKKSMVARDAKDEQKQETNVVQKVESIPWP